MKVLKDNYTKLSINENNKPHPRKCTCEHCGSELEYDRSDITFEREDY